MKGQSTIGTYLYIGTESADTLFHIKQYPDLGGSPEQIEVTDCEDEQQMNVAGVQSRESIDFLMNFKQETFADLQELLDDGKADLHFELRFGEQGEYGLFTWTGCGTVRVNGGDVNSAREMTLTVFPDGEIVDATELPNPEFTVTPQTLYLSLATGAEQINVDSNWESGAVWESSAPEFATVEPIGNGKVAIVTPISIREGTGIGNAQITASPAVEPYDYEGEPLESQCDVTIYSDFYCSLPVSKSVVVHRTVEVYDGGTIPEEAYTEDDWSVSNPSRLSISASSDRGWKKVVVYAKAAGGGGYNTLRLNKTYKGKTITGSTRINVSTQ